ncbi:MAG: HDOD domain-containing protein [Vallitaleaceae bacterium]|nr:HDOD domain-containing protein [Vallitaleaceae bacterium]
MTKVSLGELVSRVDEIPVFSETVNRILTLLEDPKADAKGVEHEIMKDQGFTAKVLRLANSAYFGGSRKIHTVSQATVLLGFQAIKSMVLASSVGKVLVRELPGYALEKEELWRQSQICAITSRVIAKKVKYSKPDQAYTAGLLHDIGKVILDYYLSEQYQVIQEKMASGKWPFVAIEEEVLGFHHGQVGAKIAEKWRLPEDLVEAIELHHTPSLAVLNPQMVSIIHIADGLVMMLGLHLGADGLAYEFSEDAMKLLKIDEQMLSEIMSEVVDIISDENAYISEI